MLFAGSYRPAALGTRLLALVARLARCAVLSLASDAGGITAAHSAGARHRQLLGGGLDFRGGVPFDRRETAPAAAASSGLRLSRIEPADICASWRSDGHLLPEHPCRQTQRRMPGPLRDRFTLHFRAY